MEIEGTYQGFREFVKDQEEDKAINHDSWCGCAVGEYLGFEYDDGNMETSIALSNWVIQNLPGGVRTRLNFKPDDLATYGKLNVYLEGLR